MKRLSKISKEIIILPLLAILFLTTRLFRILELPIFTDEAIYTRWSQIAGQDPNWRFISLTDGKQPSFVWLDMIVMKFVEDPLLAGRLVSVGAGFLMLFGIYFLTNEVFKNKKVALLAAAIFVIFPFSLVYDRMALYDSLVAMFAVWTLYFELLLVRKMRFDIAMILGFVIGGAVLTKTSGFFGIYLMPFLFLLLDYNGKEFKRKFLRLSALLLVAVVISQGMYAILRLSPFFHIISEKNSIFVYPIGEWLAFPLGSKIEYFLNNFRILGGWFLTYFSIPFIVLAFIGVFSKFQFLREKLLLVVWFAAPFLALAVFGNTLYPRYILFMTMSLLPLVAFGFYELSLRIKKPFMIGSAVLLFFLLPISADYLILTNIAKAPIPNSDKEQYISGWPAGGGVRETVGLFQELSKDAPIFIATQGTFGLLPYSYEIYLIDNPNITIKGYWPINDDPPQELIDMSKKMDVYVVFYQPCPSCKSIGTPPATWPVELVKEYEKGENVMMGVYKFKTE